MSKPTGSSPTSPSHPPKPGESGAHDHGAHAASRPANRLASQTSPYLLQHAHNPVDWFPWGPEALERARAEDKPIFLSIGYSACHWCHVMERESFENEAVAAVMNKGFVCIKVDREERPDLDEIYMAATQAISGHGGWPFPARVGASAPRAAAHRVDESILFDELEAGLALYGDAIAEFCG